MKTITISLDGLKETHESLRHLPGSYDKILENVGKLKAADFLDHLQVTFTANAKNAGELPALYETLAALKIDSLRVGMIDPIGRAKEYQELLLSSEQKEELFSFTNEKNQAGNLPIVWGCCHFLKDKLRNRIFTCPTGKTIASVLSNGDIFVCPNVPRRSELIQGNIKTDRFSEVWEKGFSYFRKERKPGFCEGCKYLSRCKGDSLHTWDFKENRPQFCYSEIFEKQTTKYRGYLRQKYPNGSLLYVAAPEEADDIYVEPEAYQAIRAYFHMGRRHPASLFEQQMGLVGFQIDDNYVIKYVFPSAIDRLGSATAKFQKETLQQAKAEMKIIKDNFNNSDDREDFIGEGLRLLGFVHSHPAQEVLRYSEGDERLHRALYRRWGVYLGLLVQPERDEIGAYYGGKMRQGNLKMIEEIGWERT